jgi:hypothetical protein
MPNSRTQRRLRLIQALEIIVRESGNTHGFSADRWINEGLRTQSPALGNRPPREYLDSDERCEVLIRLLRQIQSGAYV